MEGDRHANMLPNARETVWRRDASPQVHDQLARRSHEGQGDVVTEGAAVFATKRGATAAHHFTGCMEALELIDGGTGCNTLKAGDGGRGLRFIGLCV